MKPVALYLLLAATPGAYAQTVSLSQYQSAHAEGADDTWRALLQPAVARALARSPERARSQAAEAASSAELSGALGQRLPQLRATGNSNSKAWGANADAVSTQGHALRLEMVTPLYDGGGRQASIRGQRHLLEAAGETREQVSLDLAWSVVSLLVELGKQQAIIELASDYQVRMTDLVSRLSEIVRADPGRASELTQARARLLQAQAAVDAARSGQRDAELGLASLLGDSGVPSAVLRNPALLPVPLAEWLQHIDAHPAVKASAALSSTARAQADAAWAQRLPQLSWVVGKPLESDNLGREKPWSTHLSMSWAAFDGGQARAARQASLHRSQMADEDQRLALQQLEYQLREAHQAAQVAVQRAQLYERLSEESAQIRQAFFEQWYQLGRRTLLDVLASETDHFSNRQIAVASRFEASAAVLRGYWRAGTLLDWLQIGD